MALSVEMVAQEALNLPFEWTRVLSLRPFDRAVVLTKAD
jgi:hypothetical protein